MKQHLPLWYLGQLDPAICDLASAQFKTIATKDAVMGNTDTVTNHGFRNTSVCFADQNHWFGHLMNQHGLLANKECGWNYDITSHEAVQYGEYGVGQHYDWHTDTFMLAPGNYERKVSVVCLMNDPTEFEGGELLVRLYEDYQAPLQKGTMIAFPSIVYHKVTEVTSGLRYSAVMWLGGPRFK